MSVREMLELAAKAAGIVVHGLADRFVAQHEKGSDALCVANNRGGDSLWNPLTDDGDAFRLAVKLMLKIVHWCKSENWGSDSVAIYHRDSTIPICFERHGSDPCAATRRAIVRAAAEIGKEQKLAQSAQSATQSENPENA